MKTSVAKEREFMRYRSLNRNFRVCFLSKVKEMEHRMGNVVSEGWTRDSFDE